MTDKDIEEIIKDWETIAPEYRTQRELVKLAYQRGQEDEASRHQKEGYYTTQELWMHRVSYAFYGINYEAY